MATLIHSIERASATVTPGERRFGQRLNSHLEDDYLCWYDVPVGHRRRYPDFVILHPGRGLLVLEVKDWKAQSLQNIDKMRVEVLFGDVPKKVANPLEQARSCMLELVEHLKRDPQLKHDTGPYRGQLSFPYGWGVVLPNIKRKQLDEMLSPDEQELVLPGRLVICQDEMTESVDPEAFQERLWGMFQYKFREPMTLPQIERVRWHLFPEIRIDTPKQAELFEDGDLNPGLLNVLDLQQEQLARNLGSGHRVIHGVAGSGKTLILGYRCVQLADTLQKPALVLCFNIALATRLQRFIAERGLEEKVRVHHFHEWCKLQMTTYHVDVMDGPEPIWVRQAATVINGVERGAIPRAQYGAVMIDEGHDFEPAWLKLVVQMVDPATDSFLLLYDDAQSIYRKPKGMGFSLSSVGIQASGRTTILRLNYRNTREILKFAYDFAKGSISPQGSDEDHAPLVEPESAGTNGPRPSFHQAGTASAEQDYAVHCVSKWLESGIPPEEIAVIYLQNYQGSQLARRFQKTGIDVLWMSTKAKKKAYNPSEPKITLLSCPSSKGLEFQAVVLVGIGQANDSDEKEAEQTRVLYVGMTRAKTHLAVTASAQNSFSKRLEALAG